MDFFVPKTREELIQLLNNKTEEVYFAAGCTDLMIKLREKSIYQYSIIDLTHIVEGKNIEETRDSIVIGAFVTMSQLELHPLIKTFCYSLATASAMLGSTQIRNLATIGGNLGNASQSADLIPVLAAYNADIIILNSQGKQKEYKIEEFILENGKTSLKQDEVIWSIRIPKSSRFSSFYKIGARKSVTISKLNGCINTQIENGIMKDPIVYLGAVGTKALRAPIIEKEIREKKLEDFKEEFKNINAVSESLKSAAEAQIEANIPDRSSKHYKKKAVIGLLFNILEDLRIQSEGCQVRQPFY